MIATEIRCYIQKISLQCTCVLRKYYIETDKQWQILFSPLIPTSRYSSFKDIRGWQFLTIETAETLCMVCLPPEEHIFRKKYLGN